MSQGREGGLAVVVQSLMRAPEVVAGRARRASTQARHPREGDVPRLLGEPLTEEPDVEDDRTSYVELRVMATNAATRFIEEVSRTDGNRVRCVELGGEGEEGGATAAAAEVRAALQEHRVRWRLGVAVDVSAGVFLERRARGGAVHFAKMFAYHLTNILKSIDSKEEDDVGGTRLLPQISFFLFDLRAIGLDDEDGWWLVESVMRQVRLACRYGKDKEPPVGGGATDVVAFFRSLQNVLLGGNRLRIAGAVMILQSLLGFEALLRSPRTTHHQKMEKEREAAENVTLSQPQRRLLPYLSLVDLRWNDLTMEETRQFLAPMVDEFGEDGLVIITSLHGAGGRPKTSRRSGLNETLTPRSDLTAAMDSRADDDSYVASPAPHPIRQATVEMSINRESEFSADKGYLDDKLWWSGGNHSDRKEAAQRHPRTADDERSCASGDKNLPQGRSHPQGEQGVDHDDDETRRLCDLERFALSNTQRPLGGEEAVVAADSIRLESPVAMDKGEVYLKNPVIKGGERKTLEEEEGEGRGEVLSLSPLPSAPFIALRELTSPENLTGLVLELSPSDPVVPARSSWRRRAPSSNDLNNDADKGSLPSTRGTSAIMVSSASLSYLRVSPSTVRSALTTPRERCYRSSVRTDDSGGGHRQRRHDEGAFPSRRLTWTTPRKGETPMKTPSRKDAALARGRTPPSKTTLSSPATSTVASSSPSPQGVQKHAGIPSHERSQLNGSTSTNQPPASAGGRTKRRDASFNEPMKRKIATSMVAAAHSSVSVAEEEATLLDWWPLPLIHRVLRTVRPSHRS
ncbi:unnamed protein product [Phytomonas sp. EM1]|nr:unnamed protein product [Phytomonas sp. EM1]|eukprot:CCW64828.1 unnamed protein product [Phytomonas sp. isolate EM1]